MQSKIKTVIIDNEPLALESIKYELKPFLGLLEIIGEANDSRSALQLIESKEPQLIISDIVLSDRTDTIFEVLNKVQERGAVGLPYVILVSSFAEEYYAEAFNHRSTIISVLPKNSLSKEKLTVPVNKVKVEIEKYPYAVNKRLFTYGDHIYVRHKGAGGIEGKNDCFLLTDTIRYIESDGANVIITYDRSRRKTHRVRDEKFRDMDYYSYEIEDGEAKLGFGVAKVAKRLDPRYFIQINPGTIINVKYIEDIKLVAGHLEIKMFGRKEWFPLTGDDRLSNFKSYFQFTP